MRCAEGARLRVAVVVGTRPEAIKLGPVIRELNGRLDVVEPLVISTGQHREMLAQVLDAQCILPDCDLGLMAANQTLGGFAALALGAVTSALAELRPQVLIVQGDTTTVAVASLAARYSGVRVGHVEAGLRSFDDANPYPEEINRRVAAALADQHFAPTTRARRNLIREGIDEARIVVTGNTAVDALRQMNLVGEFDEPMLRAVPVDGRCIILVTAHRRESHGAPLRSICEAVRDLTEAYPTVEIVFPVHPNPRVRCAVDGVLAHVPRVHLVPPLGHVDLVRLLDRSYLILSDSGGIQEEAPSFATPLLILRDVTERPEVVEAGAAILVGTNRTRIVRAASRLLNDRAEYGRMAAALNPFGDGHAAERIVAAILAGIPT